MSLESLGYAALMASLVNGSCLFSLQLLAYGRHRHISFGVLAFSSALALVGLVLVSLSGISSLDQSSRVLSYAAGNGLFILYMPFGLWGTAALFRSYGNLTQLADKHRITDSGAEGAPRIP